MLTEIVDIGLAETVALLGACLRETYSVGALAAGAIELCARQPGVNAVAVEMHDRGGPCAWYATRGFDPPAPGYLDGGAIDPLLARRPPLVQAALTRDSTWICAIVGCGELMGAIRVRVEPGTALAELLQQVCTLVSVRLAELGGLDAIAGAPALTPRQYEVTVLVSRGSTNAEIARLLAITPDAVKKHVSRALVALDVSNRAELAALAARWRCAPSAPRTPAPYTTLRRTPPAAPRLARRAH